MHFAKGAIVACGWMDAAGKAKCNLGTKGKLIGLEVAGWKPDAQQRLRNGTGAYMSIIAFHSTGTSAPPAPTSSRGWAVRCQKCRKMLGNHEGSTHACPIGPGGNRTHFKFSETDVFQWPPNVTYVEFKN